SYCTDLFIVTTNNIAAEQFSTVAFHRFESVQFFKNRLLWQLVDDLKETDFVGVFTIDSSNGFYEQSSIEEVHNSLLANIDAVATNFRKNPRLGLVFADLPMDQQLKYPLSNKELLNELHEEWQAAKQQKNLVIAEETEFIEPPHKSFWLRTESLSQLADCKMNSRFAVYILWGIDMDYAIVANSQYLPAIFRHAGEKYSSEHQPKEFDRMNFWNKCDYLFSPMRTLIKYELKKIILRFYQIYHR
ncbi:TPA: rhamnan synthesis F family protein, partial [Streptococcus suis]